MIVAKAVPQGIPGRTQLLRGSVHQQEARHEMSRNKLVLRPSFQTYICTAIRAPGELRIQACAPSFCGATEQLGVS